MSSTSRWSRFLQPGRRRPQRPLVWRVIRSATILTLTTAFYFGPWLPNSIEEARGWFRPRPIQRRRIEQVRGSESDTGKLLVVIPVHPRENPQSVQGTVDHLRSNADQPENVKVVVVSEQPDAFERGVNLAGLASGSRVVKGDGRGRGPTQNAGVKSDRDECPLLLFCHADTLLPQGYDTLVRSQLNDPDVLMTAFSFGLDRQDHLLLNFVVNSANSRSKVLWFPYGDQTLAFRREVFKEAGGFRDDYKIMEDFDLVRRIRSRALRSETERICILPQAVSSSWRRWEDRGIVKTTALNWLFCAAYIYLGVTPDRIFKWYYG